MVGSLTITATFSDCVRSELQALKIVLKATKEKVESSICKKSGDFIAKINAEQQQFSDQEEAVDSVLEQVEEKLRSLDQ
jgi:vacuolar-type H+-ATPase subunit E/Vma4